MELPQLAELERLQTGILNGISNIDLSLFSPNNDLPAASNDVMAPPKLGYPPFSDQTVSAVMSNGYFHMNARFTKTFQQSQAEIIVKTTLYHERPGLLDAWASYIWTPPLFQHAVGFNVEAVISYLFALNGSRNDIAIYSASVKYFISPHCDLDVSLVIAHLMMELLAFHASSSSPWLANMLVIFGRKISC
ncbi:hypothetical protein DKX38_000916 [Salix brachista]|uniref:Uncharacterized protein n=1 Tax=Salix brachista TaxID=2182728 RepID=A0A5N5P274_9ROSI|nr:hypothetical protein DKX38_000916 [Salix brachista]